MAAETLRTVVRIATDFSNMFIIHICLIVFMAIDTTKYRVIGNVCMTVAAGIPFSLVLTGIYRELGIMLLVSCGFPIRVCCVTKGTGC